MSHRTHVVLTVDTNRRNQELLEEFLEGEGFTARKASSLETLDEALDEALGGGGCPLDAALVDVSGFGPGLWDRCRRLHEAGIPHLVLYPRESSTLEDRGRAHGARALLLKPVVARRLLRVLNDLVNAA